MPQRTILVVEDEREVAFAIQEQLLELGYLVAGVTGSGEEAVRLAEQFRPNLTLMAIRLAGAMDGIEAARQIRERFALPVIFLTAHAEDETLDRACAAEPLGYLLKPFKLRELHSVIELGLYKQDAETKLRAGERRSVVTLNSIGDAVIATDKEGRITLMNKVAESLTGWRAEDALGRSLHEVFRVVNEQTHEAVEDPVDMVLRTGGPVALTSQTALITRDGREVPVDDCSAPIWCDRRQMIGVVLVFRDVTERRRAEREIRRQLQELHLWHDTAVGREERIQTLKQEVNELLHELGRPFRYS